MCEDFRERARKLLDELEKVVCEANPDQGEQNKRREWIVATFLYYYVNLEEK